MTKIPFNLVTTTHKDDGVIIGTVKVNENKLGLSGDKIIDVLNVKCDPMLIGSLRLKKGFFPAYHMNKDKWISIVLDGTVPSEEIKQLIELSYELTDDRKKCTRGKVDYD